jgi:hypothetical protein
MDCRALRHTIRQVTNITTFFFEAFCLFITSERLNIPPIIVTTEVSNTFVGNTGAAARGVAPTNAREFRG